MKLKTLSAALAGAGLAVVGTAGAIDLPHWLKGDPQVAAATSPTAPVAERVVPAVPMLPAGQVPNYRAIVKQSAPAVVGITVEGTHKMSAEEGGGMPEGMENDPFFKFFRGMPGVLAARRPGSPDDAVSRPRLGLHRQLQRPRPDQCARCARSQGRDGQALRSA